MRASVHFLQDNMPFHTTQVAVAESANFALKSYQNLFTQQSYLHLTSSCILNSNPTYVAAILKKNDEIIRAVVEILEDEYAITFCEMSAVFNYRWANCVDVKGDYIASE